LRGSGIEVYLQQGYLGIQGMLRKLRLKLYNLLRQVELILSEGGEIKLEKISDKKFISKKEYAPEILIQSPSFLRENPWLTILSKRGRE